MNQDKELEEAIEKVNKIRLNFYDKQYKKSYTDDELTDMCDSLSIILQYIKYDSISKKKIGEYLAEETEKYKVYKKEVDKNENLRGQLWHHMGAKNMCEKILGIEKTVTLD